MQVPTFVEIFSFWWHGPFSEVDQAYLLPRGLHLCLHPGLQVPPGSEELGPLGLLVVSYLLTSLRNAAQPLERGSFLVFKSGCIVFHTPPFLPSLFLFVSLKKSLPGVFWRRFQHEFSPHSWNLGILLFNFIYFCVIWIILPQIHCSCNILSNIFIKRNYINKAYVITLKMFMT